MLSYQLDDLSRQHGAVAYQDRSGYQRYGFTPAGLLNLLAEANSEVRKADTELIRQMLAALEAMQSEAAARSCGLRICDEAIAAARARLEDKP